jgi:hypothetical protein
MAKVPPDLNEPQIFAKPWGMAEQFTCAVCRETFDKGWTDEEAAAELGEVFPGFEPDDCGVVCDDCYKKMMPKPLTATEQRLADFIVSTPEWQATLRAVEDNILYGTPLPT